MSFSSVLSGLVCCDSSGWFAASGGRHALLIPLAGEEKKKSEVEREERHGLRASLAGAGGIL
jgi:hypothetical protein